MDSNLKNDKLLNKTPWFVWYISITIITQFLLINFKENFTTINPETFTLFGAPDIIEIYKGQYWGVFINNFLHDSWSQLIINLIGLWFFGAFIERRIGYLRLMSLMFLACVIPSLLELALTSKPGIGLSGVNYTLFGYILIRSKKGETFKLKGRYLFLIFMIGVLVYRNYYNLFHEEKFRTEAMTIGFFLGVLLGRLRYGKKINRVIIITTISFISISTLFYAPWSSEWLLYKGIRYHENKNYKKAKEFYKKSLKIDPNNQGAKENLKLFLIDKLESKAYDAHYKKKYVLARKYYLEILKLDPSNKWAKENIEKLP